MIMCGVLIMLVVEYLEDVGCVCEETLPCNLQYKVTQSRQMFCERLQKLRGCKFGGNLQSFLALIYWIPYVE